MKLPEKAEYIINKLEKAGFEAFAVGGCVRDTLMGRTPGDWDICTSALPEEVEKVFEAERVVETGLKHGTVTLVLDRTPYEITTYRTEGEYKDFRRPESVCFVRDIREDLSRRDFTVNAMAYCPKKGIIDLFGGQRDIESRVIRCVGDPEKRFSEDALRILRGLRFASVLGFEIEKETAKAILNLRGLLKNISAERINVEFTKLLSGINRKKILIEFKEVFEEIFPLPFEGDWDFAVEQAVTSPNVPHVKAALFHFLYRDSEKVRKALVSLKSTNELTFFCVNFSKYYDLPVPGTTNEALKNLSLAGYDIYHAVALFKGETKTLEMLDEIKKKSLCYHIHHLDIGGRDLMNLGVSGKAVGELLEQLLSLVMEGKTENKKEALLKSAEILKGDIK